MSVLTGFAPWIVYWVLIGNVPFTVAVLAALAAAAASFAVGRARARPGRTLDAGGIAIFALLAVLTFTASQAFLERWVQPLSNAGILLVALTSVLVGRPFVREFAEVGQSPEVIASETFARTTTLVTWVWVGAFAGMTVSAAVPPVVQGNATLLDTRTPLSFVCYWLVPFALLFGAALASRVVVARVTSDHGGPAAVG